MKEISIKKWGIAAVGMLAMLITAMALLTYMVDPYFHYHKPFGTIRYRLYEQRYINDGISRHFEYDAVITGNSLSQNAKTSQFDELFQAKSIKLPYSGAGYKELWGSLDRTLSYNPDVRQVFVIMDFDDITREADYMRYTEYPDYLYDDNIWNDASYLWNKDVFYHGTLYNLLMTLTGEPSTTFDEYSAKEEMTGAEVVLSYVDPVKKEEDIVLRPYEIYDVERVTENIEENIVSVTKKYPNVKFYIAYSVPSIAKWCYYYNRGEVAYLIEGCKTATEVLLKQENVELYSFLADFELVCNLDNYSDTIHYTPEINSFMMESVAAGEYQLTRDNYEEHVNRIMEFYTNFDYGALVSGEDQVYPIEENKH